MTDQTRDVTRLCVPRSSFVRAHAKGARQLLLPTTRNWNVLHAERILSNKLNFQHTNSCEPLFMLMNLARI